MLKRFFFFSTCTIYISFGLPLMVWFYNLVKPRVRAQGVDLWLKLAVLVALFAVVHYVLSLARRTWWRSIAVHSYRQRRFLYQIPERWINLAIFGSAGLSLLLELTLIRWQGCVFELFSLYKNFSLLACFAGLGLGYTLASKRQIPLLLTPPLLLWQVVLLICTRYGPKGWNPGILRATPVLEQLDFVGTANTVHEYVGVNLLLIVCFMLTALALIPVGQVCGAMLTRRPKLQAYGLNLLGSIAGVVIFVAFSFLYTPPVIWFGVSLLILLAFQLFDRKVLYIGQACTMILLMTLAWPTNFPWSKTYSPYQLLELGPGNRGYANIRAAGHFYQKIYNLAGTAGQEDDQAQLAFKYELPYRISDHLQRVAIVGVGTGNDAAAALRMGAKRVDAIEIDPLIMEYGAQFHPEKPYADARVSMIVNDARTHLRQTNQVYDLVVYGMLDSHTLLSHGSSVRLDSFVYTVEAFREARQRLTKGGYLCVSFSVITPGMGKKMYLMLKEAFDGRPPVCIGKEKLDGWVCFIQRNQEPIRFPQEMLAGTAYADIAPRYADPNLVADVSTDDWPFFYMVRRSYPYSYIVVVAIIVILSSILTKGLVSTHLDLRFSVFFLLGAGFMLIETKGITELGLTFGNTWLVIAVVIIGVLIMAYLANHAVLTSRVSNLWACYVFLLFTLILGWIVSKHGGMPSTLWGRLATVAIITSPMFFSGLIFSISLKGCPNISGAMAANLLGAMLGGVLEYNSMYFGFGFLYWLAMALYGLAFLASLKRSAILEVFPERFAPEANNERSPTRDFATRESLGR